MANEIRLQISLSIKKGNQDYQNRPTVVLSTPDSDCPGPTPGKITVPLAGVHVDLSQLTTPGHCILTNLNDEHFVTYGIWDITGGVFFPLGEIPPSSVAHVFFSRFLQDEISGTGTGSSVTGGGNKFHLKADHMPCDVKVEAFER